MLRRIISIPEGVYYRGRFRATTAWSKVSGDLRNHAVDAVENTPTKERQVSLLDEIRVRRTGKKAAALAVRPATE